MPLFVSKRRPSMSIIAVTPSASIYRRLVLLYGVSPVFSNGLMVKTKTGGISKLKTIADIIAATAADKTNSDMIFAITEKDVNESPSAKPIGLQLGDPVVFCAGYHQPFPVSFTPSFFINYSNGFIRVYRIPLRWLGLAILCLKFNKKCPSKKPSILRSYKSLKNLPHPTTWSYLHNSSMYSTLSYCIKLILLRPT